MLPERRAGQFARAKTRHLALRGLVALSGLVLAGVIAGLAWGFASSRFLLVELAALGLMGAIDRFALPVIDRWDRGAAGEEHVGTVLEDLRGAGWHVLHDIDLGRGNVDHVIVGPAGVLTIETKSHGGRLDIQRLDERMLKQAYAQSKAVSELVGLAVTPLLVFSRAYLYPRAVSRQRGVIVLPARMLPGHLQRRAPVLNADEALVVYERLRSAVAA